MPSCGRIKTTLRADGDIAVAGEAADGTAVLELLQQGKDIDLLLMDMTMPGISGVNLLPASGIGTNHCRFSSSACTTNCRLPALLQAGASGFITKGSPQETLMLLSAKFDRWTFRRSGAGEQMMFENPCRAKMFA